MATRAATEASAALIPRSVYAAAWLTFPRNLILAGFRQHRAATSNAAESAGWEVEEYVAAVQAQAQGNGVNVPCAISVD